MQRILRKVILEIMFPARCVFCKKSGNFWCDDCMALADIFSTHFPEPTHRNLDDIFSAGDYENRYLKKIIALFKYEPFYKVLARPLAGIIDHHFKLSEEKIDNGAVICFVPLAARRLRWRGFNQSKAIAEELAKIWKTPCLNCLCRTRETKIQADLSGPDRRQNVNGAFVCPDGLPIKNKTVYLIDDVFTTGATMEECAKILKHAGAAKVIGITVARAR